VDGKFAYSHYEKQPHLYDIDGKHRFKYFSHLKRLAPQSPKQPFSPSSAGGVFGQFQYPAKTALVRSQSQPPSSPAAKDNVLYDFDGKFKYQHYDATQHQFKK
jgi:hypothetical protein